MQIFLTLGSILFLLILHISEPGVILEKSEQPLLGDRFVMEKGMFVYKFCDTCKIIKDSGTQHCDDCRRCVNGFHHHCPFVSNCVGRDNLKYFRCLLGCLHVLECTSVMGYLGFIMNNRVGYVQWIIAAGGIGAGYLVECYLILISVCCSCFRVR